MAEDKELEDFLAKLFENYEMGDLSKSVNYHFSCGALKNLFF